jgi:sugar phosphate isomerase/epimerase
MNPPLIMHVNYCEQGQSLDDLCRKAVDWGFDGVEFRRKRIGIEETPEAYLDALAQAVARSGLRQVSFGWPTLEVMTPDAAKREAEVELAARFYELAARRFRLTVCNAFTGSLINPDPIVPATDYHRHGSGCATKEHWHWAVSSFQALVARTQPLGIRFAFETHMQYLHDLPAAAKRLVEAIGAPNVGINLDYANTLLFPNPPSVRAAIEACGDKLFLVHLKNLIVLTGADHLRVGLADGQINHRELLRGLKEAGYTGPLCLEAPRPGDREWFAQQDLAYLKSLLKEME